MLSSEILIELEITSPEQRLDQLLLARLIQSAPTLTPWTRNQLKVLFQQGAVRLGSRKLSASEKLSPGKYTLRISGLTAQADATAATPPQAKTALQLRLPIVYQDSELLILNKKSGVPSVPQRPDETETACGAALAVAPELVTVGRGGYEPGILHRLDTGTSGLLLFAKTQSAFEELHAQWKARRIEKVYRALSAVSPEKAEWARELTATLPLKIETPLGHHPKSSKKMVALHHGGVQARGRPLPALSHVLQAQELEPGLWDITIAIETGVMHQIRVHLASVGLPLLGDTLYGGAPSTRLWLHAWRLGFSHSEQKLRFQGALPEGWPSPAQKTADSPDSD